MTVGLWRRVRTGLPYFALGATSPFVLLLILDFERAHVLGWTAQFLVAYGLGSLFPWAWTLVEVPLPDNYGTLAYAQLHSHPFLAEFQRQVVVESPDGGRLQSPIMSNFGGNTRITVSLVPQRNGEDGHVVPQESHGVTWINLRKLCLYDDTKPSEYLDPECDSEDMTTEKDWQFIGEIVSADDGEIAFKPESQRKPTDAHLAGPASPRFALPYPGWSFAALSRPHPQHVARDLWIDVRGTDGRRIMAWFESDEGWPEGGPTTLFWYAPSPESGPYLLVGRFQGLGTWAESTLIDLDNGRAFRVYRGMGVDEARGGRPPIVPGMIDMRALETGWVSLNGRERRFLLRRENDDRNYPVLPLPAALEAEPAEPLGVIDIGTKTFAPAPRPDP